MAETLMPTMRFRWIDKAMTNVAVENVLQQFWAHDQGSPDPGEWVDVPHAGHVTKAPKNTLT